MVKDSIPEWRKSVSDKTAVQGPRIIAGDPDIVCMRIREEEYAEEMDYLHNQVKENKDQLRRGKMVQGGVEADAEEVAASSHGAVETYAPNLPDGGRGFSESETLGKS